MGITLIYLCCIDHEGITIDFFYTNIIFVIFYLVVTNIFVEKDKLIYYKLHRYNNKLLFFKEQIKKFTLNISAIIISISFLNCLLLFIIKIKFELIQVIYYALNIFFIIEIIYLFILSFSLKNKINLMRYVTLFMILLLFTFGKFNRGITPINLFKYILYPGSIVELTIHYIIWLLADYIILDFNSKRVEI